MKKVYLYNSHFTQFTLEILDNLNMKTTWKQSQRKQIGQVPLHRRASILNQDQTVSVTVSFKNHILSTSNPPYPFYLYFLIVLFKFNGKKRCLTHNGSDSNRKCKYSPLWNFHTCVAEKITTIYQRAF